MHDFETLIEDLENKLTNQELSLDDPLWIKLDELIEKSPSKELRFYRRGGYLTLRGELLIKNSLLESAREELKGAYEIYKKDPHLKLEELKIRNLLATIQLKQGEIKEAIHQYEEVLKEKDQLPTDEASLLKNLDLGYAYLQSGDFEKAITRLQQELYSIKVEKVDPHQFQLEELPLIYYLAQAHYSLKQYTKAQSYYHQVVKLAKDLRDFPFVLKGLYSLAQLFQANNHFKEAMIAYQDALEVALNIPDYAFAIQISQNRGFLARQLGEYQNAIGYLEDSLTYAEKTKTRYAIDKTINCQIFLEIGEAHAFLKKTQKAKEYLDRAWHMASDDPTLENKKYYVLLARCRAWKQLGEANLLRKDLVQLNYYAGDDHSKQEEIEKLKNDITSERKRSEEYKITSSSLETKESLKDLLKIFKINQDLSEEMPLNEFFRKILGHAIELSGSSIAVMVVLDAHHQLKPALSLNAQLNTNLCDLSLKIANQVLNSRGVEVIKYSHETTLGAPIIFKGELLGILYLSHSHDLEFYNNTHLIEIINIFCNQVAVIFKNQLTFDQYKKEKEELFDNINEIKSEVIKQKQLIQVLPSHIRKGFDPMPIIGRSHAIIQLVKEADKIASSHLPIVILGEKGTGKELLAQYIHRQSKFKKSSYITINYNTISNFLDNENLPNHQGFIQNSSFNGTIFIKEINGFSLKDQQKILENFINARIIASSDKKIEGFMEFILPPLRERLDDLPLLVEHFLKNYQKESNRKKPSQISKNLLWKLIHYQWPGNILELNDFIRLSASLCESNLLDFEHLPEILKEKLEKSNERSAYGINTYTQSDQNQSFPQKSWYQAGKSWKEHELLIYASALFSFNFDVPKVASSLGVGVATVYKWLRENKIKERKGEWLAKVVPYQEGKKLDHIRKDVFREVANRHRGHPYYGAKELDVAPVTFYHWIKNKEAH